MEAGGENVRFPRAVVEQHRAGMPPKFTFRARDPAFDRTVPDDAPVVITGSSAPDMVDPATGIARRALAADIARIAWLVDQLPNYDIFSVSTLADDAPPAFFSTTRLYAALKYCRKPIRISGPPEELDSILKLAHIIAGGEAAYMERPFITHHYCPCVSPLTMDYDSTATLIYYAERGLPGHPTLVPNAGLTSPLTLAGTLVQGNAEFLAAVVLEQMVRPGKATIYSSLPTVADMRTGAYAPGAIETGMLFMGVAQMARFYDVPCGGYIGLSNAKVNDAQSGFETGMSGVAALLSGNHLFNMAGLLDALMSFDFAKAVIDDEIVAMLRRIQRGLEMSEENFALDVIREVGPGGMFADHLHTLERMRTTGLPARDRRPRSAPGLDREGRPRRPGARHAAGPRHPHPRRAEPLLARRRRAAPAGVRRHDLRGVLAARGLDARPRRGAVRPGGAPPPPARPAGLRPMSGSRCEPAGQRSRHPSSQAGRE